MISQTAFQNEIFGTGYNVSSTPHKTSTNRLIVDADMQNLSLKSLALPNDLHIIYSFSHKEFKSARNVSLT